jgi:tetratricopeptide (TPR) repeat protein
MKYPLCVSLAALVLASLSNACIASPLQAHSTPSDTASRVESGPYAKFLPPIEDVALPAERPALNDFATGIARSAADPTALLEAGDKALAKLPAPTKFRGLVQLMRAGALSALNRQLDALDAVQESVRLLPEYSAPLIGASSIYAYLNRPGEGADYLVRAIDIDPQTVRTVDDYEIGNLMLRLKGVRDERRIRMVSDRLLEIGWLGTRLGSRSGLAVEAIKRRANQADLDGARALVPKLLVPNHSYSLLMDNQYQALWPDIETWAGSKLERQWTIYLTEARARWATSKSAQSSQDYLSALIAARHYKTAVRDLLPLFEKPDRLQDYDLIFAVNSMAETLARLDRWKDADAQFAHAQTVWPIKEQANALNIAANYARFLLFEGRSEEGLTRMNEALAEARRWGPVVNLNAVAAMHHYRACMLHQLGRDAEAGASMAAAVAGESPTSVASLHLCLGDAQAAKKALIAGLENEELRDEIIGFVQLPSDDPLPSDYARAMRARMDALRTDPDLLKAIAKYGRVVPWAENAGALAEAP